MKVDIVLLTWDQLEYLRPCVESIFKHTHIPSRLIIVDNGSGKETREYLKDLNGNDRIRIEVLTNEKNEGFVRGMNRGMRYSDADYVCLLNNDTLVTDRWLEKMIEVGQRHPDIGILNPNSSTFGLRPKEGKVIDDIARELEKEKGGFVEVGGCSGFCMLIKREVINKIGYLDESLRQIFFEDIDYSMSALSAGFRLCIARASYVYHYEHRAFKRIKKREEIFRQNQAQFFKKWGKFLRIAFIVNDEIGGPDFKQELELALSLVRNSNFLYLLIKNPLNLGADDIFKRFGFITHANIHFFSSKNGINFNLFCLWRIVKRRKKKFDIIVCPEKRLAQSLERLTFLHKAEVVSTKDKESLLSLCKKKKFR